MDLSRLRGDTPGCSERIHLNNAGAALMPFPVLQAIVAHLELESRIGGYEAAREKRSDVESAYQAIADLLGCAPRNIAFTENATASYIQALSSVPLAAGDVLLTTRNDYVSNQIQFLSLRRRFDVQVVHAPDLPCGGVDIEAMRSLMRRHRPRLVCATQVPTSSGLVQDVAAIGEACAERGIRYLVDACQSVGQLPVRVSELKCDFLSATSRKFLRGPRGSGFLYVSDQVLASDLAPLFPDLRGADWISRQEYRLREDARRFENWEFSYALVLGTGEAARYARSVGIEEIRDRIALLAGRLREGLRTIPGVRVLDRGASLCGIVTVWIEGWTPAQASAELYRQGINTSVQKHSDSVFHFDDAGTNGALRLSPHYYNTEDEIDAALEAISGFNFTAT